MTGTSSNPKNLRTLVREYPLSILGIGAILLLSGIVYQKYDPKTFTDIHAYASIFIKELGFALIIAYFITIGIEALQRETHNEHVSQQIDRIKRDVFEAVYSTRQDRDLVGLLEAEIFNRPFFRTGYHVSVTMTQASQSEVCRSETKMHLDIQCEYYVNNTSNGEKDFVFRAFLERPFEEDEDIARLTYLKLGQEIFNTQERLAEVDERVGDTPDFRHYEWTAKIRKEEALHVVAKYRLVKRARDYLVWQVLDASDGLRVDVTLPQPGLLRIFGDAVHTCQDRLSKIGGGKDDRTFNLRIDQPLLPHNGIQLWWAPDSNPVDGSIARAS